MVDAQNAAGDSSSFRAVNRPSMASGRSEDAAHPPALEPGVSKGDAANPVPSTSTYQPSTPASSSGNVPTPPPPPPPAAPSTTAPPTVTSSSSSTTADPTTQSHPMTTTTSTSSDASVKDTPASAAAPYGTRSRNRPGTSRPNYAEDVEMDFELSTPQPNGTTTSEPPSRASLSDNNRQSPGAGSKKAAVGAAGNGAWSSANTAAQKDASIPGTSTFAANPNATTASEKKKRKGAAANAATNGNISNSLIHNHGTTRRPAAASAASSARETNMLSFEKSGTILNADGQLEADDGTTISLNDHVYLICEPPGEPYYLCRIMDFLKKEPNNPNSPVDSLRVNWFYRPRDVQRYNNDTRLVYCTMHSDICPLLSLRGKCQILHRSEIDDLDEYRKGKDCFYWNQVFDRFIHRWYDAIPTSKVINVPEKVKKALDERWKFIVVETSRVKELTSAVKNCKRCNGYCATDDSVECAVCHNTYHMNCVRPPLLKKPSRGFAWACGPCSKAQERKLEARRTPIIGEAPNEEEEEELFDEEEEVEPAAGTTAPSPSGSNSEEHPTTQAEIDQAKMWPMRYLGIHCRVEDALQYDDRAIYPRASSRLGPRHQANIGVWHGRPLELVKPAEIKRRYVKSAGNKKDSKLTKETVAAMEADKAERARRPKWVQDEPPGYVRRGEDHANKDQNNTAKLQFKMPPLGVYSSRGEDDTPSISEEQVYAYMERAKQFAKDIGVPEYGTNFLDRALQLYKDNNFDADAALKQVKKIDRRKDLREPDLTKEETKRFEEGVAKYGSELRNIRLHVKTISHADTVRYYYHWKKTPKGREIWGTHGSRKGKNKKMEVVVDSTTKPLDEIAHDQDDSAFDNDKAVARKRGFQCKFCSTRSSRQWRRAPGVTPGQTVPADGRSSGKNKGDGLVLALCHRCAILWRKYAIIWEGLEEMAKKVAQSGGKAWKRKLDEELLNELAAASEAASLSQSTEMLGDAGTMTPPAAQSASEPAKKKQKTAANKDAPAQAPAAEAPPKKQPKPVPPPKAPTPPPQASPPKWRTLPCAVCRQAEPDDQRLECSACKLTVHRNCYGITEVRPDNKWTCDMCRNDWKGEVSYKYECILCPVTDTPQDLFDPPKVSHKKKTDREREKERLDKEAIAKSTDEYRQAQRQKGRPESPREPLKKTADNNWVHVHCAVWTPETKFSNARTLDVVEGIGAPTLRYDAVCKLCKSSNGACVACQSCHAMFHVGCAHAADYTFGFDVTPVKGSRRDTVSTFTLGVETGSLTAAIWCKEHTVKTIIHPINEVVEEAGTTALQLFVQNYKQADKSLTGTSRKASLFDQSSKIIPPVTPTQTTNRRTSAAHTVIPRSSRTSSAGAIIKNEDMDGESTPTERKCAHCHTTITPKWWKVEEAELRGHKERGIQREKPQPNDKQPHLNGKVELDPRSQDVYMADAPDGDISLSKSTVSLCHKCYYNLKHPPSAEELSRSTSQVSVPDGQQLPLRSPPTHSFAAPPMWSNPPLPPAQAPPPLPGWSSHQPPPPLANGIVAPPPPQPVPHLPIAQPPYHAVLHHGPPQPNGYPPLSGPSVLPPAPAPPVRSPYPPPNVPPPLALSNPPPPLGPLSNGMHSPRVPLHSPTHPALPSRQPEGPFVGAPGPRPVYMSSHGSPAPLNTRPTTPRDAIPPPLPPAHPPLPPPPPPPPVENRPTGGASASPNLRNLLH